MKPLRALFLLPLLWLHSGCATDPEDRAFFDRGWIKPDTDSEDKEFYHDFFWDNDKHAPLPD